MAKRKTTTVTITLKISHTEKTGSASVVAVVSNALDHGIPQDAINEDLRAMLGDGKITAATVS